MTYRHVSKVREDTPSRTRTEEKAFNTIDLLYDYTLPSGRSNVTVAVLNAGDEDPPIRHRDLRTTSSFLHDLRGRMYRVGINWGF